jgi:Mn-containing catalase
MFHHVKDLQFNARVSRPDPRFANLLLSNSAARMESSPKTM